MHLKHFVALLTLSISLGACSLSGLLNADDPPAGAAVDPNKIRTYQGAVGLYNSALYAFAETLNPISEDVGIFTDELTTDLVNGGRRDIDSRTADLLRDGVWSPAYPVLQAARIQAGHAATVLKRYGSESANPQIGNAYAMQAQSMLHLAELFCSGIPLTDVPFEGDVVYTAGLTTNTVLERAVELFDSAYKYGKDSLPIATLAQVGKGRALLGLGKYAEAAAAVNGVLTSSAYNVIYSTAAQSVKFWTIPGSIEKYRVLNNEGDNGIKWVSDTAKLQDPRVPISKLNDSVFSSVLRPEKFRGEAVTFVLANGIQARMIEAEAQLQPAGSPSGPWLATLNAARATIGLTAMTDPGSANGRIDLLFRERAFWFYLTGQRLSDMRRLVRQYGRLAIQVYPVGAYPNFTPSLPTYGNAYVFVLQDSEQDLNPLYTGCNNTRP